MPNGSMIVGFKIPPLPAGATVTGAEYHQRLVDAYAEREEKLGLVPLRGMWTAMKDVPQDVAGWGPFFLEQLEETNLDTAHVSLTPSADDPYYCITTGSQIECYTSYDAAWTGAGADPFVLSVDVGGPNSPVVTRLGFQGTIKQNLPD